MFEKRLDAVSPQSFVADGTANGLVTVANATLFKVKQDIRINAPSLPQLQLEVKSVISVTQLVVGPQGGNIRQTIDISAYTVAAGAFIDAAEQKRNPIDMAEVIRAVYDEEPAVRLRTGLFDQLGRPVSTIENEDGTISISVDIGGGGSGGGGLAPSKFDDVKIIKNSSGDPIQYQFYLANVSVGNINVYYDTFGAAEYKKA